MNQVLSVIVPIYNKEKYIEKCVTSIQKWGGVSV
jgi:glycosyltransferase involved in cell wall biosynthesis